MKIHWVPGHMGVEENGRAEKPVKMTTINLPGTCQKNVQREEVEGGKSLVEGQTRELLQHTACTVQLSTGDTGTRQGSNAVIDLCLTPVLSIKGITCGDRNLSEAQRKRENDRCL